MTEDQLEKICSTVLEFIKNKSLWKK
jgi:hypothetical protein